MTDQYLYLQRIMHNNRQGAGHSHQFEKPNKSFGLMFLVIGSIQPELKGWPIGIHVMKGIYIAESEIHSLVNIKKRAAGLDDITQTVDNNNEDVIKRMIGIRN
jgi:hypothetical protein